MKKTYITFGQDHTHRLSDVTIDCDSVVCIHHPYDKSGREIAFRLFDRKFCFEYTEEHFDPDNHDNMKYFPRGIIEVDMDGNIL